LFRTDYISNVIENNTSNKLWGLPP